ncbi:MAG TPA: redoxin domain-containing protein [Anaerolineales bacterium]|nr:redoxin domain-containing protein [Anaerolineales bacterium]
MKRLIFGLLALALFGCSIPQENMQQMDSAMPKPASLPDLGPAPELTNNTWLNVDSPLRLADLRGKVVLLEMWTFGCINCQNVMPWLKEWHSRYEDQGLVIIGNHYPEFSFEEDLDQLKDAVKRNEIEYAVAQDNDGATWRAYQNRYWPTLYLIDKQGSIRYVHIGEGRYQETEENIKALLEETY